jgi:hypothetical protein
MSGDKSRMEHEGAKETEKEDWTWLTSRFGTFCEALKTFVESNGMCGR